MALGPITDFCLAGRLWAEVNPQNHTLTKKQPHLQNKGRTCKRWPGAEWGKVGRQGKKVPGNAKKVWGKSGESVGRSGESE